MKIEVLGTSCPSCHERYEKTKLIAKELGIEASFEYIDDVKKMIEMGMMQSPILLIDGKAMLSGAEFVEKNIREVLQSEDVSHEEEGCGNCGCGDSCCC